MASESTVSCWLGRELGWWSVDSLSLHRCVGVSGPQHICAPIHYFNALRLSTNATDIASMHHRHRRPPPVQSFTPYPPIHLADLSRPAARQPSRPGLPIPQLLPPRRRHRPHLRPVLLSSRDARFQSEPPWGQEPLHRISNSLAPPVKRYVLKCSSALASGSE